MSTHYTMSKQRQQLKPAEDFFSTEFDRGVVSNDGGLDGADGSNMLDARHHIPYTHHMHNAAALQMGHPAPPPPHHHQHQLHPQHHTSPQHPQHPQQHNPPPAQAAPPATTPNPKKRQRTQKAQPAAAAPPVVTQPGTMPPPAAAATNPQQPAAAPAQPTPNKRSRTNTAWTQQEEQLLKQMRDSGASWSDIAKSFPARTEGSVKKHWYKDMHWAEFGEEESALLLAAIKDYDANKWKVIGAKVNKPAKACEAYAKENFAGKI